MGIGPTALRLYEGLLSDGHLQPGFSVCELGSQDFVPKQYGEWHKRVTDKSAKGLYEFFGMSSYTCIDLNGEHGALKIDLNTAVWTGKTFDLVTNHGTSEHVFNQLNCFRFIHDLTKPGGLMIHIVPCVGYERHGFFRSDELLFEGLQTANGYGKVRLYEETDRYGTLIVAVLRKTVDAAFVVPVQKVYGSKVPR